MPLIVRFFSDGCEDFFLMIIRCGFVSFQPCMVLLSRYALLSIVRIGCMQTRFWEDLWLGEVPFNELFPRLYALENNKECSVAVKMQGEIDSSFRRHVRGGVETQQLENIQICYVDGSFECS
ncbi:hypothetical protein Tco_0292183 [Tanacetum coccineum]